MSGGFQTVFRVTLFGEIGFGMWFAFLKGSRLDDTHRLLLGSVVRTLVRQHRSEILLFPKDQCHENYFSHPRRSTLCRLDSQ